MFAEKSEEISAISARKCRYRKKITKMSVSDKQITKKGKNQIYIGKKVIHNPEGVCTIDGISKLDNSSMKARDYYKLVPLEDESMAVYVPVESIAEHVRNLRSKKEVQSILESCRTAKTSWDKSEQKRITKRRTALQNDDGAAVAALIKTYHKRKEKHQLSATDRNWLKKAEQFLGSEIAEVLNIDFGKAISRITQS